MKHLKNYKLFLENNKDIEKLTNYILDKISSGGIESLTKSEKNFLDSIKDDPEAGYREYNKVTQKDTTKYNSVFISSDEIFSFTLNDVEMDVTDSDDGTIIIYKGKLFVEQSGISWSFTGDVSINEQGIIMDNFVNDNSMALREFCEDNKLDRKLDTFLYELSVDLQNIKIK